MKRVNEGYFQILFIVFIQLFYFGSIESSNAAIDETIRTVRTNVDRPGVTISTLERLVNKLRSKETSQCSPTNSIPPIQSNQVMDPVTTSSATAQNPHISGFVQHDHVI